MANLSWHGRFNVLEAVRKTRYPLLVLMFLVLLFHSLFTHIPLITAKVVLFVVASHSFPVSASLFSHSHREAHRLAARCFYKPITRYYRSLAPSPARLSIHNPGLLPRGIAVYQTEQNNKNRTRTAIYQNEAQLATSPDHPGSLLRACHCPVRIWYAVNLEDERVAQQSRNQLTGM